MTHRRSLLLLLVLISGIALVTSTGGFSSASTDRSVQVDVVEDANAYLGFEQTPTNTENGTTDLELTISNQFPPGTDLTAVTVTINNSTVDLAESDPLEPGEEVRRTFSSVSCDDSLTIEASGSGASVRLERAVACE